GAAAMGAAARGAGAAARNAGAAGPGGARGREARRGRHGGPGPAPAGSSGGADITGPAPTTEPPSPPPTSDPPRSETLTSAGGTVTATCDGAGRVRLTSPDPADGYKVTTFNGGPAGTAEVAFKRGNVTIRMSVTCDDGAPTATTTKTTTTG
ncbi:hypothetical protein ABZ321_57925, partial [Dactylosporangium sp. NPDC006015]